MTAGRAGNRLNGYGPNAVITLHPRPLVVVALLAAFLLLPSMATIGMFMDGTIYAAISRNLAEGVGTMWALHFSAGLFPVFREHTPLVFWLQSFFFRLLGDGYLTERVYDLVVMLATAWLMRALWLRLVMVRGLESLAAFWWLPLLLWVLVPKWSWAYRNNVLESTLALFCLLSVLLVVHGLRATDWRKAAMFAGVAAAAALLAFLAKGPVGLFVLAAPVLLVPAFARIGWRRVMTAQVALAAAFALLLAALLAWPDAREMLAFYWQKQVVGRSGVSGADSGMLFELVKKLAPMLLLLAGLRLWVRRDGRPGGWRKAGGPAVAMLAIGLAASLPLVMGDLDSAHYLVPALPFYALGFGLVGAGLLEGAGDRTRPALEARLRMTFKMLAAAAAVVILVVTLGRLGEVRRNEDYHAFLAQVAEATGERVSIGMDSALYDDWYLHAIAQRHHRISLVRDLSNADWRLAPAASTPAAGYRESGIRNEHWALRRRED
ncbi:MAG: hypothetical protein CMP07_03275 [Xanthomonadales bacterium]|nr:hypothetical protein [Xanthomonadales bacterium]